MGLNTKESKFADFFIKYIACYKYVYIKPSSDFRYRYHRVSERFSMLKLLLVSSVVVSQGVPSGRVHLWHRWPSQRPSAIALLKLLVSQDIKVL